MMLQKVLWKPELWITGEEKRHWACKENTSWKKHNWSCILTALQLSGSAFFRLWHSVFICYFWCQHPYQSVSWNPSCSASDLGRHWRTFQNLGPPAKREKKRGISRLWLPAALASALWAFWGVNQKMEYSPVFLSPNLLPSHLSLSLCLWNKSVLKQEANENLTNRNKYL